MWLAHAGAVCRRDLEGAGGQRQQARLLPVLARQRHDVREPAADEEPEGGAEQGQRLNRAAPRKWRVQYSSMIDVSATQKLLHLCDVG